MMDQEFISKVSYGTYRLLFATLVIWMIRCSSEENLELVKRKIGSGHLCGQAYLWQASLPMWVREKCAQFICFSLPLSPTPPFPSPYICLHHEIANNVCIMQFCYD